MANHAALSPSKRHRWALCPGSVREEAKYPEQESGPAALDGTHSHHLLGHCIIEGLLDPGSLIGQTMRYDQGDYVVTKDRADRVKMAIDYVSNIISSGDTSQVWSERRVNPEWLTSRTDLSGTVDIQIVDETRRTLEIIDYKDGMVLVDVTDNPQLEQYAVGALAEYQLAHNVEYPFDTVRMTIIQPKLALRGLPPISSCDVDVRDVLGRITDTIVVQAHATDAPDAPLVPGESQCKYCRVKANCAAAVEYVMDKMGVGFGSVVSSPDVVSPLDLAQQSADQSPETMHDRRLQQIMEAAPLVRQLLDAVEDETLRRWQSGHPVPGTKVVIGRGSRAWVLPEEQMVNVLVKMGIPKPALYERKMVSPAKAEKISWKKRDGTLKQLSKLQVERMGKEYVTHIGGKLTVVLESDSRPAAVLPSAAGLFSPVETEQVAMPSWLS